MFLFIYSIVSRKYQAVLYLEIVFVCTTYYRFYFCFVCIYIIVQTVGVYVWIGKKMFWRTLENDVMKGPLFHTIH